MNHRCPGGCEVYLSISYPFDFLEGLFHTQNAGGTGHTTDHDSCLLYFVFLPHNCVTDILNSTGNLLLIQHVRVKENGGRFCCKIDGSLSDAFNFTQSLFHPSDAGGAGHTPHVKGLLRRFRILHLLSSL